jgi:hypothetical protein
VPRVTGFEAKMVHHLSSKSGDLVKHGEVFVGRVALSEYVKKGWISSRMCRLSTCPRFVVQGMQSIV